MRSKIFVPISVSIYKVIITGSVATAFPLSQSFTVASLCQNTFFYIPYLVASTAFRRLPSLFLLRHSREKVLNMLVQYLLVSLFIPLLAATHAPNPRMRKRHTRPDLAVRGSHSLSKRFDNTRFTFYAAGLGACGQTNTDSDFVSFL